MFFNKLLKPAVLTIACAAGLNCRFFRQRILLS